MVYVPAAKILDLIDPKVNPCDNFYKFACGKFLNSTVIPKDDTDVPLYGFIDDKIEEQVKAIIEEKSPPHEPKPFKLTKNFYRACMNQSKIFENYFKIFCSTSTNFVKNEYIL